MDITSTKCFRKSIAKSIPNPGVSKSVHRNWHTERYLADTLKGQSC